ncbi:MAG: mechanosensitive ion channel protein [Treponema sp.]|nr:MAG: mechanosensitive ion channel protein [Treponema sp.]
MNEFLLKLWDTVKTTGPSLGLKVLYAVLTFIVGWIVIKVLMGFIKKAFKRLKFDQTLGSFLINILSVLLKVFLAVVILGQLGVETTSFVAILGAAGLAVGFALQGSLASFASGVLIIILKPFVIGDYVAAGGVDGTVFDIGIFATKFKTVDNKVVIVPNTSVMNSSIINYSKEKQRRIDLVIGVGYDDDIRQVEAVLKSILNRDSRILKDPAPTVGVLELADNSVNFAVRPWVATSDYWPTYFDLMKEIKITLDQNGITIPYPQRDVHLYHAEKDSGKDIEKPSEEDVPDKLNM